MRLICDQEVLIVQLRLGQCAISVSARLRPVCSRCSLFSDIFLAFLNRLAIVLRKLRPKGVGLCNIFWGKKTVLQHRVDSAFVGNRKTCVKLTNAKCKMDIKLCRG